MGLDPGKSGGLVAIFPERSDHNVWFKSMPPTERDVWDWVTKVRQASMYHKGLDVPSVMVCIEEVTGYVPRFSKKKGEDDGQPGSAMFKFGWSYGGLRMALVGNGFEEDKTFHAVPAKVWQAALGISPRRRKPKDGLPAESDTEWKNRLKSTASALFPRLLVTLAVADALLIAHYCRLTYGGVPC